MTTYALRRGNQWISAPGSDGKPAPTDDQTYAWLAPTLDTAHELQYLVRMCWGWTTEIRAIHR